MKHAVLTILFVVIIVVSTVIGVRAWDKAYSSTRAKQIVQQKSQQAHDKAQAKVVADEKKRINNQCYANQSFYDAQAVAYKKANARPVCDLKLAQ